MIEAAESTAREVRVRLAADAAVAALDQY